MPDLKDDFEDRLKKYRELIRRVAEPSKSLSSRSRSHDPVPQRPLKPSVKLPRKKMLHEAPLISKLNVCLEISGFSLQHSHRETPPLLQPLSRSMAASSRRRLISHVIQSQELSPLIHHEPLVIPPSVAVDCALEGKEIETKHTSVPADHSPQSSYRSTQESVFKEIRNLLTH